MSEKFLPVRRLVSGRSITVIDKDGICYDNLKKLNMNVNDLMEAVRSAGYPDLEQIMYAIIETNGKSALLKRSSRAKRSFPCR